MDPHTPQSPESQGDDIRDQILARISTAAGRQKIGEDLQSGGYERRMASVQAIVAEAQKPGADQLDIKLRAAREAAEAGLMQAAENPAVRKVMTENAEAYARKNGIPFEPVREDERWAKPHALSPTMPESAKDRLIATTDAVDRTSYGTNSYGQIAGLADRAATRDGRAGIAEEICTGKVRGGIEELRDRFKDVSGPDDANKLAALVNDTHAFDSIGNSFGLNEADQPDSRDGMTALAREHAQRHGRSFEEVEPSEPWASKDAISRGSCYTANLDVGGAPNRSKSDVAQMIERTDRQVAAETGSRTPVARGRDDALSL